MNKIQLGLFTVGILAIAGLTVGILRNNKGELKEVSSNPQFSFYNESLVDELSLKLRNQGQQQQADLLNQFMKDGHKFFTPNQILKVLQAMPLGMASGLNVIKPYIPPMSTEEALQILSLFTTDYLSSKIIISQIYDLNQSKFDLIATKYPFQDIVRKTLLDPQAQKSYQSRFLLTTEGQHVGFLFDGSKSMSAVVKQNEDGTFLTRLDLMRQFYSENRSDILSNFLAFTFNKVQPSRYGAEGFSYFVDCPSCLKGFDYYVKSFPADGETDLYSSMWTILKNYNDQLSDLYIWTDGIVSQNTQKLEDFISLINFQNTQRKNKIRINTISFLVGGEEPQSVRDEATTLLQTLSDYTGGTYIQYQV